MGLAEPHVAAYAQSVNPRFTMRGLDRSARPKTRYVALGGARDMGVERSACPLIGQHKFGFAPV